MLQVFNYVKLVSKMLYFFILFAIIKIEYQ